jgi:hypothetical protein
MSSTAARNENSVQFSLAELRDLHADRIATQKEAEEQRRIEAELHELEVERQRLAEAQAAQERRIAAEYERERQRLAAVHELELAREQARLDAEARVQEKKLALELKQADVELARAQAMTPRRRGWPVLVAVAVLVLGLQAALFRQQSVVAERVDRAERSLAAAEQNSRTVATAMGKLESVLVEVEASAKRAQERADGLEAALAALDRSRQTTATPTSTARNRDRNRDRDRNGGQGNGQVNLGSCVDQPLGCLTN